MTEVSTGGARSAIWNTKELASTSLRSRRQHNARDVSRKTTDDVCWKKTILSVSILHPLTHPL